MDARIRENILQKLGISVAEYERLLAQIIDTAPDCIKLVGPDGEVIGMNDAGLEMVGIDDPKQVIGKCIYDLIGDEFKDLFRSTVERAFRGKPSREVYELVNLKGRRLWLEQRAVPFVGPSGYVVAMLGVTTDITENRRRADAQRESEEQYRGLVEDSPILMCRFLPNFEITFVNSSYSSYYRVDADTLIGSTFLSNAPNLDHKDLSQRIQRCCVNSSPEWHEYQVTMPDGELRWQRWTIRSISNQSNDSQYYQAVGEDITVQKKDREELLQLNLAVENSMRGISRLDTDGRYTMVKKQYADMTGYAPEELIGLSWEVTVPEEDQPKVVEAFVEMQNNGRSEVECRARRKDGSIFDKQILLVRIDDEFGRNIGHYCFMSDISERVRAEKEQRRLNTVLAQSQRLDSIGRLAGGVAHDFNNILGAIVGNAELLMRLEDTTDLPRHVQTILTSATRAGGLCQQLLTLSGNGAQEKERVCLEEVIDEVLNMTAVDSSTRAVVKREFDDLDTVTVADRVQVTQVALNLLLNAFDASKHDDTIIVRTGRADALPPGKSELFLQTWDESAEEFIYLEVEDFGVGIHDEKLSTVFEPFFTSKQNGHGLGLAAVMGIVRAHNGALELESKRAVGSRFRAYFPSLKAPSPTASMRGTAVERLPHWVNDVVIADDEAPMSDYLATSIRRDGADVRTFDNGQSALDKVLEIGCDLIILDFSMPGLDGVQVATKLREQKVETPIILITGFRAPEIYERLGSISNVAILQKPFGLTELYKCIGALTPCAQLQKRD